MLRSGNGSMQSSESYCTVGTQEIDLGVFTLDARGVPLLMGVRTLERLGAILDIQQSVMVMVLTQNS